MDKDGNLNFNVRNRLHKDKYKSDSVWNNIWVLMLIIIACAIADFANFFSLFSALLYDNAFLRAVCIVAMILCMEVAPCYLGFNMKRRACGYNVETFSIIIPFIAFLLGVGINTVLRLSTHYIVHPDLTNVTTSIMGGSVVEPNGSQHSLILAWFFSILPLITSLIVYAATYSMSDPLKAELKRLTKTNIDLTDQIDQIEAILAEYDSGEAYLNRLLTEDEAKFNTALAMIKKRRDEYCSFCRQKIAEHLGTAAAANYEAERYNPQNY